jgi:hypothetical protein
MYYVVKKNIVVTRIIKHGASRALACLATPNDLSPRSANLSITECTLTAISALLDARDNICKSRNHSPTDGF